MDVAAANFINDTIIIDNETSIIQQENQEVTDPSNENINLISGRVHPRVQGV